MNYDGIIDVLRKRWSPLSFKHDPIDEKSLEILFKAAGLAPSSNNEQPWLFVYATRADEEKFEDFIDLLNESNRVWARHSWALIYGFARLTSSYKGRPNRFAVYDTGMAVANLLAQATSMGIYLHQMGGFSVERTREYFNLKDDIQPLSVIAAGYLGDGSLLPRELAEKDKTRKTRMPVDSYTFRRNLPDKFMKS
jgi:nitroreductase